MQKKNELLYFLSLMICSMICQSVNQPVYAVIFLFGAVLFFKYFIKNNL